MKLLKPCIAHIPEYVSALRRGWSPDNLRSEVAQEQIQSIEKAGGALVRTYTVDEALGGHLTLEFKIVLVD